MAAFFFWTIAELCKILYLEQTQAFLSSPRVDNKENPLAPKPRILSHSRRALPASAHV